MAKYIDADALKRWIQAECNPYGAPTLDYASSVKIMERIDKMPAVDVEPVRHSEWINSEFDYAHCSECAFEQKFQDYVTPFCPSCGAKMDGGSE